MHETVLEMAKRRNIIDQGVVLHELNDEAEYGALDRIAGDERSYSLGGLPLALINAGSYCYGNEISFREYIDLYEEAQKVGDLKEAMDKARNYGIVTEYQLGIWTT